MDQEIQVDITTEIHFYNNKEVAVVLENNSPEKDKKFAEILLFSLYSLRVGMNLSFYDQELMYYITTLMDLGEHITKTFDSGNQINLESLKKDISNPNSSFMNMGFMDLGYGYFLTPYPGRQGEKIFFSPLKFNKSEFYFTLKWKGFGFLNLGGSIAKYAPLSVEALFKYLLWQRSQDEDFIKKIGHAAFMCSSFLGLKKVNVNNQHDAAFIITFTVFEKNNDSH
jgi:hypothetical protein